MPVTARKRKKKPSSARLNGQGDRGGVTIDDIAKRAQVSKSTVSRILNGSAAVDERKQEAVRRAIKELDYRPNVFAQGLASGRSMTLGILIQNIGSPFYDTIAQGAIGGLAGSGYTPLFVDGQWEHEREAAAIDTLIARKVDGLLLVGGDIRASELKQYDQMLPLVVVARDIAELAGQCVSVDNQKIGYLATRHLLDQRHRRIVFLHGNDWHPDAQNRFAGYLQALREAKIKRNDELIYMGDFSANSGLTAINYLLDQGVCFSGVVAANDMVAFGARLALYRRGVRVPDDVSIIGCDDQAEAAFMTPPLTTVRQPSYDMGFVGARALVARLANKEYAWPPLEPVLQIRESVKRFSG